MKVFSVVCHFPDKVLFMAPTEHQHSVCAPLYSYMDHILAQNTIDRPSLFLCYEMTVNFNIILMGVILQALPYGLIPEITSFCSRGFVYYKLEYEH